MSYFRQNRPWSINWRVGELAEFHCKKRCIRLYGCVGASKNINFQLFRFILRHIYNCIFQCDLRSKSYYLFVLRQHVNVHFWFQKGLKYNQEYFATNVVRDGLLNSISWKAYSNSNQKSWHTTNKSAELKEIFF